MQNSSNKLTNVIYLLSLYLLISGCATIVGTPSQSVSINSSPSSAKVTITDEAGMNAFSGTTPTVANLDKHNGSYFGGKNYKVKIEKAGYSPQYMVLNSRLNGWYIAGNFFTPWSIVGWLVVDPFNGGMYTLTPEAINISLGTGHAKLDANMTKLHICLLEDVPEHLRGQLQPINQAVSK